jgi:hypothetical protein
MSNAKLIHKAVKIRYPSLGDKSLESAVIYFERKLKGIDIKSEYKKVQAKSSYLSAKKRSLIKDIYELATKGR